MRFPVISELPVERVYTGAFRGYNHNRVIGGDEFYEMENMSSDEYPLLSPRRPRRKRMKLSKPHGLHAHEKLCWVDGTKFYYDGEEKGTVEDSDKQFVSMGASVIIWPDKKIYNRISTRFESLSIVDSSVSQIYVYSRGETLYQKRLKVYCDRASEFHNGDLVELFYTIYWEDEAIQGERPHGTITKTIFVKVVEEPENTLGYISIAYLEEIAEDVTKPELQTFSGNVSRNIPDMDYICEHNNRLWGCSSASNELFCSKLGDPFNWFTFNGDSQDSWSVNVGTQGAFTGICVYQDSVLFFKEDCIHRLYGTRPQNYQISTILCEGVEEGSSQSVRILDNTVFYKGRRGVNAFSGALPILVSSEFGTVRYTDAQAEGFWGKYYISMTALSGVQNREWSEAHPELLVYDTAKGLWHKEGREKASFFTVYDGELLFIDENGELCAVGDGEDGMAEACVPWMVQTGRIQATAPDFKHISSIQIRASLDETASIKAEIRYDGAGQWVTAAKKTAPKRMGYTIPVLPRRCEFFELRLSGTGDTRIQGIAYVMEQGSEL